MDRFDIDSYTPEPISETERLIIREIGPDDIPAYHTVVDTGEAGVDPELRGLDEAAFTERHIAYIRYQYGFYGYGIWGLFLRAEPAAMIGIAGIFNSDESGIGELCYAILPQYRRQGYAYEACREIVDYALSEEIGFSSLIVRIAPDNTASLALAHKLGIKILQA